MKVFEAQYQRELTCGRFERIRQLARHARPRHADRAPRQRRTLRRLQQCRQLRQPARCVSAQVLQHALAVRSAAQGTRCIQQWQVRLARTEVLYAAASCMHELAAALGEECIEECRLSDARLTAEHDAGRSPCERAL